MTVLLPLFIVLLASIFQGSFGLGMKFMNPLKWEAWWLIHSFVAMIFLPFLWAFAVVPDLFSAIFSAPVSAIYLGMFYGFLWGIGGIMFGKSIPFIGISLTYGIVMGSCSAVGSLIPLFGMENVTEIPAFPFIIVGVFIMLIGVGITAYAGILRDKENRSESGSNLKLGLLIALISGVLSALLNVGFVEAQPIGDIAKTYGALDRNSSLAVWVLVLWGAFIMNAGYALLLLYKNQSWKSFTAEKSRKAYRWAILSALFWFGALGIYGQGATLMGDMGPVIGWPILLGLSLIISNIWAYLNNEWQKKSKSFKWLLFGLLILIIATLVLGLANGK